MNRRYAAILMVMGVLTPLRGAESAATITISDRVGNRITRFMTGACLEDVNHETAEPALRSLVEELGLSAGQVFGLLRAAVTGQTVSPPLFESMAIIGRKKVLERVAAAEKVLEMMGERR